MRLTTAAVGVLVVAVVSASGAAVRGSAAAGVDVPPAPADAPAASPCHLAAQAPDSWRVLADVYDKQFDDDMNPRVEGGGAGHLPQYAVDPAMPCRIYRAPNSGTLERSTNAGKTWQRLLYDRQRGTYGVQSDPTCSASPALISAPPLCAGSTPPFAATGLVVTGSQQVVLTEGSSGDAVLASTDAGHHWELRNGGIEGRAVVQIAFSPQSDLVAYAVTRPIASTSTSVSGVRPPTGPVVYVTQDGGSSWRPTALPSDPSGTTPALVDLRVDPLDPSQVWLLYRSDETVRSESLVVHGSGYGTTWQPAMPLQNAAANELVVVRTLRHPLRIFLVGSFPTFSSANLLYSDDGAGTWLAVPLLPVQLGVADVMAVNPVDPERALVAVADSDGHLAGIYYSTDAFDTYVVAPLPGGDVRVRKTLVGASTPLTSQYGSTDSPTPAGAVLQADALGGFSLALEGTCLPAGDYSCPGYDVPFNGNYSSAKREFLLRYVPPAVLRDVVSPATVAQTLPGQANGQYVPHAGTVLASIKECPLPSAPPPTSSQNFGTLTFDGVDLLYTQDTETGPNLYQGIIHKMSPVTCLPTGDVVVDFRPQDLEYVESITAPRTINPTHPNVEDMTYDPTHNEVWLSLRTEPRGGTDFNNTGSVVFRMRFADATETQGTASLPFVNGCGYFLAYDWSDQTLWTCDTHGRPPAAGTAPGPGHIRAVDGASIPSCFSGFQNDYGTWAWVSRGRLLLQDENDTNLDDVDAYSCRTRVSYVHRPFSEPLGEDEQLVCDPLSFAGGLGAALQVQVTSLWIRDAQAGTVGAYALPTGTCPLPTRTVYSGPATTTPDALVQLCATVILRGRETPLAGVPVDFTVAGVAAGRGWTDNRGGPGCVLAPAPHLPGRFAVQARFPGDSRFTASLDLGTLLVATAGSAPAGPAAGLAPPPGTPAGGDSPVTVEQPAPGAATSVAQSPVQAPQAQAQSQPAAQSQPGAQAAAAVEPERQLQLQVAAALEPGHQQQAGEAYEMTAMSPADPLRLVLLAVAGATLLGVVGFGVSWALRMSAAVATVATGGRRTRRRGRGRQGRMR